MPQRYRGPLLLCYWEGKTRDEAATQLGMTAGKLHGLLERGRELLRDRLTKRGLTLSAALCSSLLVAGASSAALDPSLVVASTKAALLLAAGGSLTPGLVSTHVITLTKEALHIMFVTKLKIATASILGACLVMALIGGTLASVGVAQDKGTPLPVVVKLDTTESDEAFIRRMSKDLRGIEPTPAEVHFFVSNKDAGRRQKLIDLFIQERQAKGYDKAIRVWDIASGIEAKRINLEAKAKSKEKGKPNEADPLSQQRVLEAEMQRIQAELDLLRAHEAKQKGDRDRLVERQDLLK